MAQHVWGLQLYGNMLSFRGARDPSLHFHSVSQLPLSCWLSVASEATGPTGPLAFWLRLVRIRPIGTWTCRHRTCWRGHLVSAHSSTVVGALVSGSVAQSQWKTTQVQADSDRAHSQSRHPAHLFSGAERGGFHQCWCSSLAFPVRCRPVSCSRIPVSSHSARAWASSHTPAARDGTCWGFSAHLKLRISTAIPLDSHSHPAAAACH